MTGREILRGPEPKGGPHKGGGAKAERVCDEEDKNGAEGRITKGSRRPQPWMPTTNRKDLRVTRVGVWCTVRIAINPLR